jgi:hypothetical protein
MLIAMAKHAHDGPYTIADLKDARKLRLGLLLLYQARIGQKNLTATVIESTTLSTLLSSERVKEKRTHVERARAELYRSHDMIDDFTCATAIRTSQRRKECMTREQDEFLASPLSARAL